MPEETGDHFVTLSKMIGGAVDEVFGEELRKVLANIGDINTDPEAERTITLKLTMRPDEQRRVAGVGVSVNSKVAPVRKLSTVFYLGRHKNQYVAVESDPKQRGLFENKPDIQPVAAVEKGA